MYVVENLTYLRTRAIGIELCDKYNIYVYILIQSQQR